MRKSLSFCLREQLPLISLKPLKQLVQNERRRVTFTIYLFNFCVPTKVDRDRTKRRDEDRTRNRINCVHFHAVKINSLLSFTIIIVVVVCYVSVGVAVECVCLWRWKLKRMVMAFDRMNEINHLPKHIL